MDSWVVGKGEIVGGRGVGGLKLEYLERTRNS